MGRRGRDAEPVIITQGPNRKGTGLSIPARFGARAGTARAGGEAREDEAGVDDVPQARRGRRGKPQAQTVGECRVRQGGQIEVWTGLSIPVSIWREGRESPSGMRSQGRRSRHQPPWHAPVQRVVVKAHCRQRAERSRRNKPPVGQPQQTNPATMLNPAAKGAARLQS